MGQTTDNTLPKEINWNDLWASIDTNETQQNGAINSFEMPTFNLAQKPNLQSKIDATNNGFGFGNMFNFGSSGGNDAKTTSQGSGFGSTLQGIGAVTGALASIYGIHEQKKYQNEVLGMEKERVAKNEARRDAKQAEYDKVWGA